ncbi:hypothetical protein CNECB9_1340036 [Cupriavidus necator]|uniref:Uncharacterized protein n=1 Tax=Cupriavidus necator TaxID=106590 RepID=A0A1K0I9K6_CUPNE|nr:hypothetical protein CNECB9_1340036 [Cupriavidus necator]
MARAIAAMTRTTAWLPCMTGPCDRRMKTGGSARARKTARQLVPGKKKLEAGIRNRTVVYGFAGRCITTLPPRR